MLEIAQRFASVLDAAKFDEAAALMSEDCRYEYWEGKYQGRQNIAAVYRNNHEGASKIFDEVQYASEVEPLSNESVKLRLFDRYRLGDRWHESRSEQILKIENNLVTDIQHHELPGEAEALHAFFQSRSSPK